MAQIHNLFHYLSRVEGSDLHLVAGLAPRVRRFGALHDVEGAAPLTAEALTTLMREIVDEAQWAEYAASGDLDFAYGLEGVARFRVNYLRQHHGPAAVFRLIPERVRPLAELGLPAALGGLADLHRGLVLVTGPTGSGKSTTLAAILDRVNSTWAKHVVTIENPVEFVHPNRKCVFSQREVGTDTATFGDALRAAMRQDADVILVGEMRDLETTSLAITAAEMGSLVFATLHTNGAAKTIDRLVDVFPAEEQPQIRTTLASSIAGIVTQLLLPAADGEGAALAFEILLRTQGLANVIRESNTPMIRSIIQSGKKQGMRTMDESLMELVRHGKVTAAAAHMRASVKQPFEALMERETAPAAS